MKKLELDSLEQFLKKYYNLHDSSLMSIYYDIEKEQIELIIDLYWENGKRAKNGSKLNITFKNVKKCNNKEMFRHDFIDKIHIKFLNIADKKMICFATSETNPLLYIVCENIEYEEIIEKSTKETSRNNE